MKDARFIKVEFIISNECSDDRFCDLIDWYLDEMDPDDRKFIKDFRLIEEVKE